MISFLHLAFEQVCSRGGCSEGRRICRPFPCLYGPDPKVRKRFAMTSMGAGNQALSEQSLASLKKKHGKVSAGDLKKKNNPNNNKSRARSGEEKRVSND